MSEYSESLEEHVWKKSEVNLYIDHADKGNPGGVVVVISASYDEATEVKSSFLMATYHPGVSYGFGLVGVYAGCQFVTLPSGTRVIFAAKTSIPAALKDEEVTYVSLVDDISGKLKPETINAKSHIVELA